MSIANLYPGVSSKTIQTSRLKTHYLDWNPSAPRTVVMVHGNLSTGRFFEHLCAHFPDSYRLIMPDMRSFGRSETKAIDATRGLKDWADDIAALLDALSISAPVHLAGWSTGGAAIADFAMAYKARVASLSFIDPVSPFGFGGSRLDGTPCYPDWSGTGGGASNPEFTARLSAKDRTSEHQFSPSNIVNASYWAAHHTEERLSLLVDEVLLSVIGDSGFPGDASSSNNWPGFAPGTQGILNALSGKYCNWSGITDLADKPPILWVHGGQDAIVANQSHFEMGTLGKLGVVPGYPGEQTFPPQMMVQQIAAVLQEYGNRGGYVQTSIIEEAGHAPFIDSPEAFNKAFFTFLDRS